MSTSKSKSIGELNGFWSLALRAALVVFFGAVVPLNVFYVVSIQDHDTRLTVMEAEASKGNQFTEADGVRLEIRMKDWHSADLAQHITP